MLWTHPPQHPPDFHQLRHKQSQIVINLGLFLGRLTFTCSLLRQGRVANAKAGLQISPLTYYFLGAKLVGGGVTARGAYVSVYVGEWR
jgi:hypothetical protein